MIRFLACLLLFANVALAKIEVRWGASPLTSLSNSTGGFMQVGQYFDPLRYYLFPGTSTVNDYFYIAIPTTWTQPVTFWSGQFPVIMDPVNQYLTFGTSNTFKIYKSTYQLGGGGPTVVEVR